MISEAARSTEKRRFWYFLSAYAAHGSSTAKLYIFARLVLAAMRANGRTEVDGFRG